MKRYALFAGVDYSPCGGWGDFRGAFDSVSDASDAALAIEWIDWWQVIDLHTGEEVACS